MRAFHIEFKIVFGSEAMKYSLTLVAVGIFSAVMIAADLTSAAPESQPNLVTDESRMLTGKPDGAPDYVPKISTNDGQHLALTMRKLEDGISPRRPFLIWAIGSSYCNMLGNGEAWRAEIAKRFPNAPVVEYRKMVGNSCPWQYLRGWAQHLVIPDQPDLVLIYTIGKPEDLEKLIVELRAKTTADVIVPSIHWRERDGELWGKSENAADQDVLRVREICRKHRVEFVENRQAWGEYLHGNKLSISSLLKDAVHQSDFGADHQREYSRSSSATGEIQLRSRGTRISYSANEGGQRCMEGRIFWQPYRPDRNKIPSWWYVPSSNRWKVSRPSRGLRCELCASRSEKCQRRQGGEPARSSSAWHYVRPKHDPAELDDYHDQR